MTAEEEVDLRAALTRLDRLWGEMPYGGMASMPLKTGDPSREPLVDKASRIAAGYESLRDVLRRVVERQRAAEEELDRVKAHRRAIRDLVAYITSD